MADKKKTATETKKATAAEPKKTPAVVTKKMTQTETIGHLADKTGVTKAKVKDLLTELANLATAEVKQNGEFTMPGFGKLVKSTSKEREGRNPATGATIKIAAKTSVKFRVGKAMKDAIGGK